MPSHVPDEVGVLADALHLGPWTLICPDCGGANELSAPHIFLLPDGSLLTAVPGEAPGKAARSALLGALQPAIGSYVEPATDDASTDIDRAVLCVALLCAVGVLRIDRDGDQVSVRTRNPPDDPEERRASFEAAVYRGAESLAGSLRRPAPADARALVPDLTCPHRPVRHAFGQMLKVAVQRLAETGPVAFVQWAAVADLAAAAGVPMPFGDRWAVALLHAEAARPVESEAPLVVAEILAATLDPAAVVAAVGSLAGDIPLNTFWGGGAGRRARAAIARLIGGEAAARVMLPRLDLSGADGSPPDLARASAEWPRVVASLPDRQEMAALLRAARHASIDVAALLEAGLEHLADAGPVERAAFAVEASGALAFDPAALLRICMTLGLVDDLAKLDLPPELACHLGGAVAEAWRNTGQPDKAIVLYRGLEASATTLEDRHHAQQGVGSCLRALKRYDESVEILRKVVAEAGLPRRVMATNALARTYIDAGREEDALAALKDALPAANVQAVDWPARTQFLSMYVQLSHLDGDSEAVQTWGPEALRSAEASGSHGNAAAIAGILQEAAANIDALETALAAEADPSNIASFALTLAVALNRAGDGTGAIRTLETALPRVEPAQPITLWVMFLHLALLRIDGKPGAFGKRLAQAVAALESLLVRIGAASDADSLLKPYADERQRLVDLCVYAYLSGIKEAAFLRRAVDLVMAPVLTARLRATVPGAEAVTSKALMRLCRETPCVLVQVLVSGTSLKLVFSQVGPAGEDAIAVHDCAVGAAAALQTVSALAAHAKLRLGRGDDLGLDRVPGWMALATDLQSAMADHCGQFRLVVCPGPLGSLVLSLALPPPWSISFVPSLGTLLALRARRRALPAGLDFVPKRLADFAVWQEGDPDQVVTALQGTEPDGRRIAENHDLGYDIALGRQATGDALMTLLGQADLLRIACHGRIEVQPARFELLVAADGELPPAGLIATGSDAARPHRLEQRALADLGGVAPYVFSSACCSGAATLTRGGERIGLERALFLGGSVAVCAPQWDVHSKNMRDQLSVLLDLWLGNLAAGLDVMASQTMRVGASHGIPPRVTRALSVFGDGLGRKDELDVMMVVGNPDDRAMAPPPVRIIHLDLKGLFDGRGSAKEAGGAARKAARRGRPKRSQRQ